MRQCAGEGRQLRRVGGPLRAIVIVNPTAGGGRTRGKWPGIRDQLFIRNIEAQFRFTTGPGDATVLAKEAVESGFDTLIAVGGDGTINEVANGARFALNPVRLGIIPTGTGRDIARSLGIRGVDHAIDLLALGNERKIDAGVAAWTEDGKRQSRYFLLYCGTGFVTDVNRSMTKGWKRLGNTIPYASGTIRQLRRPPGREMTWSIDGVEESGRQTAIVVFNQQYFGGGMKAAPGALADDGLLDVMAVGDVSRLQALTILATIYSGRHVGRQGVWHKPAKSVRIDGPELWFDLDGEVIWRTPVEVNVAPGAITLAQ